MPESEGLFARRLLASGKYFRTDIDFMDFMEIVEEAEADYPSLTSLGLVPILSDEDIMKVSEERHKWFLRWFVNDEEGVSRK